MNYIRTLLLMFIASIVLTGCFHRKGHDVVEEPTDTAIQVIQPPKDVNTGDGSEDDSDLDADEEKDTDEDTKEEQEEKEDDHADEYDENGEFDPKKFQDDDIDEVMDLLKELLAE